MKRRLDRQTDSIAPLYGQGSTALGLQSHYEETGQL